MRPGDDDFDYETHTREYYQNDETAGEYHEAFTDSTGLNGLRFRLVASRERAALKASLQQISHDRILDIPAGTGKLAPVFSSLESSVVAADVSKAMLAIAREEYRSRDYGNVSFVCTDAETISRTIDDDFDVVVCLRLLHRVPREVKTTILAELARVAEYAIVSFGADSTYHTYRRRARQFVFGGAAEDHAAGYEPLDEIDEMVAEHFDVLDRRWVIPVFSQEIIYLLKRTTNP
jgi:ubiquinone/menaquinone biosynthesis C-methylase UbiE